MIEVIAWRNDYILVKKTVGNIWKRELWYVGKWCYESDCYQPCHQRALSESAAWRLYNKESRIKYRRVINGYSWAFA